jgi:peptidyl-dipeptidase Dcp
LQLITNKVLHAQNNSVKMTNPLLQKVYVQYQAPFNLIKDKDFKPAFEYGLGFIIRKLWQ